MSTSEFISSTILQLQESLKQVNHELDMINSAPCIELHNSIVCWPETGLTVDSDNEGKPFVSAALFATQFTFKAAQDICENVTNGKGQRPVVMTKRSYYNLQERLLEDTIETMSAAAKIL